MSYPTGGSGYNAPATPPAPASSGQSAGTGSSATGTAKGLPFFLVVGVAVLGVINFLLGFLPYAQQSATVGGRTITGDSASFFESQLTPLIALLLLGGLLAGLSLLPKQSWTGAAAAASITGFLALAFQSFTLPDGYELKIGAWVVLFLSFVQAVVAVVAVLFEAGILTPPAPKPATPQGPPSGFGSGGYGQPGTFSAFGQNQPGQYGQSQPGQYGQSQPSYGSQTGPQYQSPQPYGQSQPGQPSYGQPQQPSYGQQPAFGQQPGYGAAQQGSPYGAPPAAQPQPRPDESATQHFGVPQSGQQYGAPSSGKSQPGQQGQPFGGETGSDPSSDATHAFRPSEDNK
ncbi:DUF5336 domain-containing protein [Nocardia sp. NBC_00565]|uniref:DUF5336 domain-containing protein n=1 Tax=Nocardia sp. NBC_00565 TaxID=2975993 RepID=UPI002E8198CB|nr:DUF5336 domain-containing protein [Nocardia sp. NBC_00565]WUC01022.1 DUF5336 domain-containing protein [Nocardia sp. NBC_00565]